MSTYIQTPGDVIFTINNVEDRLTHIFERVFDLIEVIDKLLKVSAHTLFSVTFFTPCRSLKRSSPRQLRQARAATYADACKCLVSAVFVQ